MTHPSVHGRTIPGLLFVGLALLVGACVPASLSHVDGREFEPRMEIVMPNSAWIAIDSCSTGIHALVELDLRTDRLGIDQLYADELGVSNWYELHQFSPTEPLGLELIFDDQFIATLERDTLEGPICIRDRYEYDVDGRLNRSADAEKCLFTYRAEFKLKHLPRDSDRITLRYGEELVYLANLD